MTPATLVQTQQVLSVLRRAKPLQEQHLAEVLHRLLDQISIVDSSFPATENSDSEEGSLAYKGTATLMDRLRCELFVCAVHKVQLGASSAAYHCYAVYDDFLLNIEKLGQLHATKPAQHRSIMLMLRMLWQHA